MKTSKPGLILFLFATVLSFSCKKSDSTKPKTKTDLLTQASWKFSSANAQGAGDITAQIPDCYKDNIYTFSSNGSGNVNESTNVCSPSTAGPFTWSFANNEATLHISTTLFPGGSSDFTLVTLNETNLVVSQMLTVAPYPTTNVTLTFVHP
jgi:hypothetical protein